MTAGGRYNVDWSVGPAFFSLRLANPPASLSHFSVWSKMAYMLNSSSGPEVAAELGDYLDKTLRTTSHLNQVKQEVSAGRFVSAVSLLIQESAHLWTSESAADKGTYLILMVMLASNS